MNRQAGLIIARRDIIWAFGGATLAIAIAVLAVAEPLYALLLMGALAGLFGLIVGIAWLRYAVFLLLVSKPIIDLAWRWRFAEIAQQRLNVQTLVAVFALLLTGAALVLRGRRLIRSPMVILLLVSTLLAVVFTPSSEGINELIRLYAGVSFFFTAGVFFDEQRSFDRFAGYFLLATMVPVGLSFAQRAGILPYEYWDWLSSGAIVGRASGTYQHPLGLVYFLIYAVPLALYLLSKPALSQRQRLALWLFIGLSLVALVFTYHRVGLVAVGLQIWLWLILTRKYRLAMLFVVGGCLLIFWRRADLQVLYGNVFDILEGRVGFSSRQFLRGRGTNWYLFLDSLFSAHPFFWLIGRGSSMAEGFVPGVGYVLSEEPHNDFVRLLHAYGFLGLGLYLGILGSLLWQSLRLRRARAFFPRHLGNVMIVVLASIVILSITTEPMRYPTAVWYLFALGSIVMVQARRLRHADLAVESEENQHGSQEFLRRSLEDQTRS